MNFKDYFDQKLALELCDRSAALHPGFNQQLYTDSLPADLQPLEMKTRVRALANAPWEAMELDFVPTTRILISMLDPIPGTRFGRMTGFPVWVIADIVETRGLAHFEQALQAIKKITRHFTGEFAIRPYLNAYPEATFEMLAAWTRDDSADVRRLVSEGTRPRLPWATRVPSLLTNPRPILVLLDLLYNDKTEYVRRSVANNLNDISKGYPGIVLDILERCYSCTRCPRADQPSRVQLE